MLLFISCWERSNFNADLVRKIQAPAQRRRKNAGRYYREGFDIMSILKVGSKFTFYFFKMKSIKI